MKREHGDERQEFHCLVHLPQKKLCMMAVFYGVVTAQLWEATKGGMVYDGQSYIFDHMLCRSNHIMTKENPRMHADKVFCMQDGST